MYYAPQPAAPPPPPPMPAPYRLIRKVGAPIGAIIALGLLTGLIVILLTATNPAGTALGFTLSTIAIAFVVLCYLWVDRWEPEPTRLLVLAFAWGSSIAVVVSVVLELVLGGGADSKHPTLLSIAIEAPFIEEAAKGAFLLIMLTGNRRKELNSLTDCLVYAGITAAGFAWLEDIVYIAGGETLGGSLATALLRLVFGPFAHPLFTSMTGIGVYFALKQRNAAGKVVCILLGYLAAVTMHGLWNGSALYGIEAYVAVYFLWMVPVFVVMVVVAIRSRRGEQRMVAGKLPGMVAAGLVSPNEATWLGSISTRKRAVAEAKRFGGPAAARSVKNFAAQVVELAFVRDRIEQGSRDPEDYQMQTEEAYGLMAARAAAPVLQAMAGYSAAQPFGR